MDKKETSLSEVTNTTPDQDKRIRWRGHHTFAAALFTVCAMIFTYAGATAASTIEREGEDSPLAAQIVTVADVSYLVSDDGALYSQGLNNTGQLGVGNLSNSENWQKVTFPVEGDQPKISKISSYGEHAIALDENGGLWTWGDSQNAALGSPQVKPSLSPSRLSVSYSLKQISAGDDFALALDGRGKLHVWGQNGSGQLGTGDKKALEGPTLIQGDKTFTAVAAGSDFSFAIDSNGALWAWGSNDSGQFGNGTKESSLEPLKVSDGPWKAVFPSRFTDAVAAINADGVLHTWGPGDQALIGNGRDWRGEQVAENKRVEDEKARIKAEDDRKRAELVKRYQDEELAKLVTAWEAQKAEWDAKVTAWNTANPEPKQEDFMTTPPPVPTPTPTPGVPSTPAPTPTPIPDIAAYEKALGKWNDARTKWLEENPEPQRPTTIPQETIEAVEARVTTEFKFTDTSGLKPAVIKEPEIGGESLTPVAIATGTKFKKVSLGSENAFALAEDGTLWAWGNDKNGQSGIGVDEDTHTHAPVSLGAGKFNDVFGGPQWATAVSNSGLFTWGLNDSVKRLISSEKKLLTPTSVNGEAYSRVSGSEGTGVASRSDGSSVSWGENVDGIAGQNEAGGARGLGAIEGSFDSVSFAKAGVLALGRDSGHIYFWGSDRDRISSGQEVNSNVLTPTRQVISRFVDVAAGRLSTHVLDANGFVWTWGLSWMGDLAPIASSITAPIRIPLDVGISKIASGQTNVLLISKDNRILYWGSNSENFRVTEGKAADEGDIGPIAQVAAGKNYFLIRGEDGKVWTFSALNPYHEAYPVELPGAASFVAAGDESFAAIVDGKAYGWGDNSRGQLVSGGDASYPNPQEMAPPLAGEWGSIAISSTHALATTTTGVLYGWGLSEYIGGFGNPVDGPVHVKIANER